MDTCKRMWTDNEIKQIASESGKKYYIHELHLKNEGNNIGVAKVLSSQSDIIRISQLDDDTHFQVLNVKTDTEGHTGGYLTSDHGMMSIFSDFYVKKNADNSVVYGVNGIVNFDTITVDSVSEI